jgi:multiple sugar transport system ATP-binding protein
MNFVEAALERDDGPCVRFAGLRLPVPATLLDSRPGLAGYFGRKVILGVRPSHFEDAALGDASWPRLPVTVSVTEELGTEIHAIFPIDAPPVEHASIASAADRNSEEDETVTALAGGKSLWTARVSSRSVVRPGQRLELAVDTSALHFFDPDSGDSIGSRVLGQPSVTGRRSRPRSVEPGVRYSGSPAGRIRGNRRSSSGNRISPCRPVRCAPRQ